LIAVTRSPGGALGVADRTVGRLGGQGDSAVQQRGDLRQAAIGNLQHAQTVGGVTRRLGQGGHVGMQAIGNRQAGCVIRTGVDTRS